MALTQIKTNGLADNAVTDAKVADAITVSGSQTGITQVGTITAGTWQGTAIASAYLDADTAHLSTTQTFSGAKTFTGGLTIDPSGDNYVVMTSGATDANLGFLFKNSSDVQKGFILYDSDDNFLQLGSGNVQALKLDSSQNATFAGGTTTFPVGGILRFGERGNLTHDSSNYNMSFNTNSVSNAVVITGTGLLQAKRGFTNGQALDIEGETFGRTNSSNVAFGYRQDGSGSLMKMQKSSTDVFIMTNSGRIAQTINESQAYCATFENTSSGGYGLRVYGGASSADKLLLLHDHNGNEKFAIRSNGDMVRGTNDYTSRVYSGYTTGNGGFTVTYPIQDNSSVLVTAMFTHYGAGINTYGCVRMVWVSCRDNSQSLHNISDISSSNGGQWNISTSSSVLSVQKDTGTYSGGGHYWIKIEGSANI